jgi:hypothetical protein
MHEACHGPYAPSCLSLQLLMHSLELWNMVWLEIHAPVCVHKLFAAVLWNEAFELCESSCPGGLLFWQVLHIRNRLSTARTTALFKSVNWKNKASTLVCQRHKRHGATPLTSTRPMSAASIV